MTDIASIRKDYKKRTLTESEVAQNPIVQFEQWWEDAIKSNIDEVNAMTLATVTSQGIPSARIVLLKKATSEGFVFFTNYQSNKAQELAQNPHACLVFFWKELERQVRIAGKVEQTSAGENDIYFASRPESSRIGAWASPQSAVIGNREIIEQNEEKYKQQFNEGNIPRPPHWGGYRVIPSLMEFWQGRPSRLHDRIQYTLQKNGSWKIERLAP